MSRLHLRWPLHPHPGAIQVHQPRGGRLEARRRQCHHHRTYHGCRSLLFLFCLCPPLLPQWQSHRRRILYVYASFSLTASRAAPIFEKKQRTLTSPRTSHRIRLTRPSNNNHFLWSPGRASATCSQSASIEVPQARPCSFAARATYTAHARSASLRVAPHHRAHVVTIARTSGRPLPRAGASPAFPRALASEAGLRCRD